ncbi:hypothetical protein O1504_13555 [Bacteroides fragilis]|uniref:hypothetical protein n=1 Tax=Bacteroides fragilis TaxID=817 RepID=UPI0022AAF6ED|nr:hypothetical protein [Bacteroides fragilis]MCZ2590824.1 hypothetical protein [Bacteroides fragilis]
MKTIKVTDAAAQFIKQLREEGIEERKVFLCDAYSKAVEHALANAEYSEADFYPLTVIHDYHKLIEELADNDDTKGND